MYGTVARMRIKPGTEDAVLELLNEGDAKRIDGFVTQYCYRLDNHPNELILVVVFRDKRSYFANADDPETDAWFKRLRANLEADPEWFDGEILLPAG